MKKNKIGVCLIILFTMPFFLGGCWNVTYHKTVSEKQVKEKLNELISEYDGKLWLEDYANSYECFSFAHYVFNNCFDRGEKRLGDFTLYGEKYPMWIFEQEACDCYAAARIGPDCTMSEFEDLMSKVRPGDYLQLQTRSYMTTDTFGDEKLYTYHSMIVVDVDTEKRTVKVFDANFVEKNRISYREFPYDDFCEKYQAITAYRYWLYE